MFAIPIFNTIQAPCMVVSSIGRTSAADSPGDYWLTDTVVQGFQSRRGAGSRGRPSSAPHPSPIRAMGTPPPAPAVRREAEPSGRLPTGASSFRTDAGGAWGPLTAGAPPGEVTVEAGHVGAPVRHQDPYLPDLVDAKIQRRTKCHGR